MLWKVLMTNRNVAPQNFSLQGCLLVAAPGSQDGPFFQAVFLIVQHSSQGAIGVLLNRGLDEAAEGLWQHVAGPHEAYRSGLLHLGGPKSGPVIAIHGCRELAEFSSAEGVYFAAQVENLKQLVSAADDNNGLKIVVGQADWESGQLDEEFAKGKWLPIPVSPKVVFSDERDMWQQAMREVGNQMVAELVGCEPNLEQGHLN